MRSKELRDPTKLLDYIDSHIKDDGQTHYVILDEMQLVDDFVEVLLSLMHNRQLEVYVSGSDSKFLSKDVVTEFRGRGSEIRVWPLSFREYCEAVGGDKQDAWYQYYTYGGKPQVLLMETEEEKREYLKSIYELTYYKGCGGTEQSSQTRRFKTSCAGARIWYRFVHQCKTTQQHI